MRIIVPDGFRYCDLDIAPESLGPVPLDYIRGRGDSTWKAAKKPYKIKLEDKEDVFGLGENRHWVLLANAFDTTTFKNRFIGWLEIPELKPDNTDQDEITGGYLIQNGSQVANGSPNKCYTDREFCLANDTPTFDPSDSDYTNEERYQRR